MKKRYHITGYRGGGSDQYHLDYVERMNRRTNLQKRGLEKKGSRRSSMRAASPVRTKRPVRRV
jgi:hypothetical protein